MVEARISGAFCLSRSCKGRCWEACLQVPLAEYSVAFAVLRQLSFFSDALGHSSLLGITLGILLGVNPTLVLIPFAVLFSHCL